MESYSIGRVFSRMVELVKDNLAPVGVFLIVTQVVVVVVSYVLGGQLMAQIGSSLSSTDPFERLAMFRSPAYWALVFVPLLITAFSMSGAMHGLLRTSSGHAASLGECTQAALNKFLPMLGLIVLWYIAITIGFLLIIVPGIILITMWCVAQPALVGENVGVFGSFGRSRTLTKGSRLLILVTLLIVSIAIYAVAAIVMAIFVGGAIFGGDPAATLSLTGNPLYLLVSLITGTAMNFFISAILVSIYRELRLVHGEGDGANHLVDVFR